MGDFIDPENDSCPEVYLTHWEKKCIEEWEREAHEDRVQTESEKTSQRLWPHFQNSASTISQLYREGAQPAVISLWVPFQAAASSATNLYKEGVEASRKCFELGQQLGCHRRTKEVLSWAKKKRRHIQRDELIAFLCGRPAPTKPHRQIASTRHSRIDASARLPVSDPRDNVDLQLFRDALGLQNQGNSRRSPSRSFYEDFHFIDPSSRKRINVDRLDSPSSKRQRICGMETDDF